MARHRRKRAHARRGRGRGQQHQEGGDAQHGGRVGGVQRRSAGAHLTAMLAALARRARRPACRAFSSWPPDTGDASDVLGPCGAVPGSEAFAANVAAMGASVDRLTALIAAAAAGGGKAAVERHRARGKWLPRERIDAIADPGSPFLELSPLAGHAMYGESIAPVFEGVGATFRPATSDKKNRQPTLPRPLPPPRRRGRARRRHRNRHRPRARPADGVRGQRRDGQGRDVLPGHRQKAPAPPGGRRRVPPALRVHR
jgi:hypothetical protein